MLPEVGQNIHVVEVEVNVVQVLHKLEKKTRALWLGQCGSPLNATWDHQRNAFWNKTNTVDLDYGISVENTF